MKIIYECEYCGRNDFKNEEETRKHEELCKTRKDVVHEVMIIDDEPDNPHKMRCPNCNANVYGWENFCPECRCRLKFPK